MRPPADLAEGVEVQVAAKKKGLGRGLDALLPEADELLPNVVQEIPVGDIDPNTEQPRRSFPEEAMTQLSASVKEQGILQLLIEILVDFPIFPGNFVHLFGEVSPGFTQARKQAGK